MAQIQSEKGPAKKAHPSKTKLPVYKTLHWEKQGFTMAWKRFFVDPIRNPEVSRWKFGFGVLAFALAILLPWMSLDVGMSGDEHTQYDQAQAVYAYYASLGENTAALNNPKTYTHYYSQSFDNITYAVNQWFGIEDVYTSRHIMNAWVGWLCMLFCGLLVAQLMGWRAAVIALLLLFLSPRFLGHSFNNPKDIPFAFPFIFTVYHLVRMLRDLPRITLYRMSMLALGIALAISVRVGGLLLIAYVFLFVFLYVLLTPGTFAPLSRARNFGQAFKLGIILGVVTLVGYALAILGWPYAMQSPLSNTKEALDMMTQFAVGIRQLFEGVNVTSKDLPVYYLAKYIWISTPLIVWLGFFGFFVFWYWIRKEVPGIFLFFIAFSALFPLVYISYQKSNVYGGWRHVLFIYPFIVAAAAIGIERLLLWCKSRPAHYLTALVLGLLALLPLRHICLNHPMEYVYFNEFIGGPKAAFGQYTLDYYYHSARPACEWLQKELKLKLDEELPERKIPESGEPDDRIVVTTNHSSIVQNYFRKYQKSVKVTYKRYYERNTADWDYAIYVNEFIDAYQLQNGLWPPKTTLKTMDVDGAKVCAIIKRMPEKWDLKCVLACRADSLDAAEAYLKQAIVYEPTCESVYAAFAEAALKTNQASRALPYVAQWLKIQPDHPNALDLSGWIYLSTGQYDQALKVYSYFNTLAPDRTSSFTGLARAYAMKGDVSSAIAVLERQFSSLGIDPPSAQLAYQLYTRNGDEQRAQQMLPYLR